MDGKTVSEIGHGLLVLVGLLDSDTDVDSEFMFVPTPQLLDSFSVAFCRHFNLNFVGMELLEGL